MEDYPKDVYRVRIGDWDMQVDFDGKKEYFVSSLGVTSKRHLLTIASGNQKTYSYGDV